MGGGIGDHSSYDWGGERGFPSACKRPSPFKAFSLPCSWLRMGKEGLRWGWREGGDSRQVRNSTGPPGVVYPQRRVREGLPMGLE